MDHPYPSRIIKSRWTKKEIDERMEFKCEHSHNGVSHASCFNKANGIEERKGCLDIESNNLKADFSLCISFCIKESGKDKYHYDSLKRCDIDAGLYDANLIKNLVEEMWKYDRIITHYGKNLFFDIPFIRARYLWLCARKLYKGPRFPGYKEMYVTDTYSMAKPLLTISSKRQNVIANTVLGQDIKTPIDRDYWMAITCGSKKQWAEAMKYIVEHNIKDTEQLDGNYLALLPFIHETSSSI